MRRPNGPEERFTQRVPGDPHERRIDRRDERRGRPRARAGHAIGDHADHEHPEAADDRLRDLDGDRHRGRRRAAATDERQERRIPRCAAERLDRRRAQRLVVDEAAAGREAAGERQVLLLVARERLVGPVAQAERQSRDHADDRREEHQSARESSVVGDS